ncbi:MAG: thiol-disulfide oxidoreductase [Kordia sp.]|nr:MAG: thiol-disulfide oxidoreductase [Kordia sp.]
MVVKIITLTLLLVNLLSYSQTSLKDSLFSEAIHAHIKTYKLTANNAYLNHQNNTGETLFNEFVAQNLINTYLDDFKAKNRNGALISINRYFKKPVILVTYASWCIRHDFEIASLNELAKAYKKEIDFVVIFWDNKNTTRKKSKIFNKHINVLYMDERENLFSSEIKSMKHALGLSLIYYIDRNDKIVGIKKNGRSVFKTHNLNSGYVQNSNEFINGLNTLLINDNNNREQIVSD